MNQLPAATYKFNNFQEIKSHSSILFNERMAILFYLLDLKSIAMNMNYDVPSIMEVRSILKQLYKNVRTLIRNNPTMRVTLNLDTKDPGTYITDVAMGVIDTMIQFCQNTEWTTKRCYIIVDRLNEFEVLLKDIMQYYHYFIRPDFKQKPDVELATERYKEIADSATVEQLKQIVGRNHQIDFESLGSKRIEIVSPLGIEEQDYVEDVNPE